MSAPDGSEELTDNFREVLTDRCNTLIQALNSDELLELWRHLTARR